MEAPGLLSSMPSPKSSPETIDYVECYVIAKEQTMWCPTPTSLCVNSYERILNE